MTAPVSYMVRTAEGARRWLLTPPMAHGAACVVCEGREGQMVVVAHVAEGGRALMAHEEPCWADVQEGRFQ